MKEKNKILLIISGIILILAIILCTTVFNKKSSNTGGKSNKNTIDYNDLYNMVPMVQRANYGMYLYGEAEITGRTIEDKVVGALNHYNYKNCNTNEAINNCDEISLENVISEIKTIYNLNVTKEDIENSNLEKNENGISFYVYSSMTEFQAYNYKDGKFSVDGLKGFVNKNNKIVKTEEKDNEIIIYENIYYLGADIDSKDGSIYEVLFENSDYIKEAAREKIIFNEEGLASGGIDLTNYSQYAVLYKHIFKKNQDGNYYYFSSIVDGFNEENNIETNE